MPKFVEKFKSTEEFDRSKRALLFGGWDASKYDLYNAVKTKPSVCSTGWHRKVDRVELLESPTFPGSFYLYESKLTCATAVLATDNELDSEIERSRRLLTWEDDWDGEGSPGYKESTWTRAVEFLKVHVLWINEQFGITVSTPQILPGPAGSIDMHWRTQDRELLINVPAEQSELATFYGDNFGNRVIRGSFDPSEQQAVLLFLISRYR